MEEPGAQEQENQQNLLKPLQIIDKRFQVINQIGSGSFGEVYIGLDTQTGENVAIKVEVPNTVPPQLQIESQLMKQFDQLEGFPELIWSGKEENSDLTILVMSLLGQNLQQLLIKSGGRMSLKTVLMLTDQMVLSQKYMGNNKMNTVYLIDFGLVRKYKDKNNNHIQYRDDKGLIGTARFVSINTHLGIGKLPWSGIKADTKEEKYEKIKNKKLSTPLEVLCQGLPKEFLSYMEYCRQLKFEEQPDYGELKTWFKELFFRMEYTWDYMWHWITVLEKEGSLKTCECNQDNCHICFEQTPNKMFIKDRSSYYYQDGSYYLDSISKSQSQQDKKSNNKIFDFNSQNNSQNPINNGEQVDIHQECQNVNKKLSFLGSLAKLERNQQDENDKNVNINSLEIIEECKQQQPQQQQQIKPEESKINFKIFGPTPLQTKLDLEKLKSNSNNLFESIINNQDKEQQQQQNEIQKKGVITQDIVQNQKDLSNQESIKIKNSNQSNSQQDNQNTSKEQKDHSISTNISTQTENPGKIKFSLFSQKKNNITTTQQTSLEKFKNMKGNLFDQILNQKP